MSKSHYFSPYSAEWILVLKKLQQSLWIATLSTSVPPSMHNPPLPDWLPIVRVMVLSVPARNGTSCKPGHRPYHDYRLFMTPATLLLMRSWMGTAGPTVLWPLLLVSLLLVPWFALLRIPSHSDPTWNLPIRQTEVTATLLAYGLLAICSGTSVMKIQRVNPLTRGLLIVNATIFRLAGKLVSGFGNRLLPHDLTVAVKNKYRGVRSFLIIIMAICFFDKLPRRLAGMALMLFAIASMVACAINAGGPFALAQIRFVNRENEPNQAHYLPGLVRLLAGEPFFYIMSEGFSEAPLHPLVKTRQHIQDGFLFTY